MHRQMADMMKMMGSGGKRGLGAALGNMFGLGGGMPQPTPEMLAEMQQKLGGGMPGAPGGMPGLPPGGLPPLPPGLGGGGPALPKGPGLPGLGGGRLPGLPGLGGFPFGGGKKK
jgi:signal recognition particle subunit SRP54